MSERDYFQMSIETRQDAQNLGIIQSPSHSSNSSAFFGNSDLQRTGRSQSSSDSPVKGLHSPSPQLTSTFSDISLTNTRPKISSFSTTIHPGALQRQSSTTLKRNSPGEGSNPRIESIAVNSITPSQFAEIAMFHNNDKIILLDMRTHASFEQCRMKGSININMPATLLKRPMYTITKIVESLQDPDDQDKLSSYKDKTMIVYDNDSYHVGPGTAIHQFTSKFCNSERSLGIHTLQGGFAAILREFPELVEQRKAADRQQQNLTQSSKPETLLKGFGHLTCILPEKQSVTNPFFNNIRQNQDLIGGVGQPIAMRVPEIPIEIKNRIPQWLRQLAFEPGGPQEIANRFLRIEEEEQSRMQRVLNAGANFEQEPYEAKHSVAAGVERGDKNRYNNIWPFEKTRVRLQDLENHTSDYVNASHVNVKESGKCYIATQGPLPGTTHDFWQVVWENDVRVIVMLTKTVEGGQAKCHPYWSDAKLLGHFHLDLLDEAETIAQYRNSSTDTSLVTRKFALSHKNLPLVSPREITHIQFPEWPDLHVINPEAILALVDEVHKAESNMDTPAVKRRKSIGAMTSSGKSSRPILSHCSAGCGRTGVFCTIDTVLSLVLQQLKIGDTQATDLETDLVEYVVRNFRDQRLSMVQT